MRVLGRPFILVLVVVSSLAGFSAPAVSAQESKSSPIAKQLVQLLDAAKLEAMAAADPATPGAFVAAMYLPGSELLVVSAKYAAPQLLVDRITAKDYQAVYVDLQSASVRGSKVFIQDQGADGLVAKPSGDAAADSCDEDTKSVSFDGDWKKAKISEADYTKAFSQADEQYAKMLSMLLAQAKKGKAGS